MYRATHKRHDDVKNERANTLFKEYADKHIEEFLQSLVSYMRPNEGRYSVSLFAKRVWGSWSNFKDYVNSIPFQNPIINEFKDFLNEYLSTGSEYPIAYKFKHINVENEII